MNVAEVKKAIRSVISHHKSAFKAIGTSQPKLLELGAVAGFVQHYTANGFTVSFLHPKGKKTFAIKTSTSRIPVEFYSYKDLRRCCACRTTYEPHGPQCS